MINKKHYLIVLMISLFSAFQVYADNNFLSTQSNEPLEITSNRMEAFNEKNLVVFSGNATVIQGKSVLKSDRLLLYYKNEHDKKDKIETMETNKSGDLEKIEAKGHVSLIQGGRVATGDEAIYFRDSNKIIMTGNAILKEGKNSIKGDRVIVFLNENKGVVESNTEKQVKAIIYPNDRKKVELK